MQAMQAGFVNDPELLDPGFKILRFGNEPVILIRVGEEEQVVAGEGGTPDRLVAQQA